MAVPDRYLCLSGIQAGHGRKPGLTLLMVLNQKQFSCQIKPAEPLAGNLKRSALVNTARHTDMRLVIGILLILMLLFMAVQYNDPDGLFWMGVYSVPAMWCAVTIFWRQWFVLSQVRIALWFSTVLSVMGVIHFWPVTSGFWHKAVWHEVETAREGMGMMIVLGVHLLVLFAVRLQRMARAHA